MLIIGFRSIEHAENVKILIFSQIDRAVEFSSSSEHAIQVWNHRKHPWNSTSWKYRGIIFKNHLLPIGNAYFLVFAK